VGDGAACETPGLLRKYQGRALLVLSGECAVHCRYCFRREFPYADLPALRREWDEVYARLAEDPDLEELIFSGGDPLSLSDAKLRWHWESALNLPTLRRVRIHTRLPVVLPSRLDAGFLALVSDLAARRPLIFVLHANHAAEIDAALADRLRALRAAGAVLLNQSVLLRGVNDTVEALSELSGRLVDAGVLPYYLHQLDQVRGASHFEIPEETGLSLTEELRRRVPGYALPRYVREIQGAPSKVEIGSRVKSDSNGENLVAPFRFSF
jgi:EF-P beta-lysylation protein EpmB